MVDSAEDLLPFADCYLPVVSSHGGKKERELAPHKGTNLIQEDSTPVDSPKPSYFP